MKTVAYPKDKPSTHDYQPLIIQLRPVLDLTDDQLYELAHNSAELASLLC